MTNEEMIKAVEAWQNDKNAPSITCLNNAEHGPLCPIESGGKIYLKCMTCGFAQSGVPAEVLERYKRTIKR